ncbi:ABC transporter permease [Wenzhouxiangella marina]|uniref:ABC transporter protein, putative n=1 Tax=Wenzhouxiangella marina TaxID=1579979 RepID=A0A0K0XZ91_9GAMM|nr:ABC transporter permease [Wenzhouxiangella marina]AKS43008.1 ABC transporter protein, putative [Wenzhouxiangella marina]MBB6087309.1 ABC-2 type transport system permease protein [Wenzhouxiangella marina]
MMLRLTRVEALKLRHSLVSLLVLAVPGMIFVMLLATILSGNSPGAWERVAMSGAAIWAYFLLPMAVTALTALMAQVEHGPRAWSWSLTLPLPKARVFQAKALLAALLMAVISLLVGLAILAGGLLGGWLLPDQALQGPLPIGLLAALMSKMWLAGLFVLAIQFIVAFRFSSFAVPVVLGISGTFFAVVATSARLGIYFPWLLPTNVLASAPERAFQAIVTGSVGGVLLLLIGCWWLGRRDWL